MRHWASKSWSLVLAAAFLMAPASCLAEETGKHDAKSIQERAHRTMVRNAQDAFGRAVFGGQGMFDGSDISLTHRPLERENLDIFRCGLSARDVKVAAAMPPPRDNLVSRFALAALILNDQMGHLTEGDKYAAMISDEADFYGIEAPRTVLSTLAATGRLREHDLLAKAFPQTPARSRPNFIRDRMAATDDLTAKGVTHANDLTRQCLNAIAVGDRKKAQDLALQLIEMYKQEPAEIKERIWYALKDQNLFCTLLNIARKYSDRKWYSDSDSLIDRTLAIAATKERGASGKELAIIELIVNAERKGHKSQALWDRLLKECQWSPSQNRAVDDEEDKKPPAQTYQASSSEKLRRLSAAYYLADELDRADILFARAVKIFNPNDTGAGPNTVITHCRETGVAGDKVLLMLQGACLRARQGRFDEAGKFAGHALSGPVLEEHGYGAKLTELAQIYSEHGKLDQAVALLQRARDKKIPLAHRGTRHNKSSPYLVDYWLAKFLYDQGKVPEARQLVESAIDQAVHPPEPLGGKPREVRQEDYDYASSILAGDCAFAMKEYVTAALNYEHAGMSRRHGSLAISEQPQLDQYWLQKAIDCADRVGTFAGSDRARLYIELAKAFARQSPDKALELDKKAIELMPDSDAKKATVLADAALLTGQVRTKPLAAETAKTQGSIESDAPTPAVKPTSAQGSRQNIEFLRQAAKVAEQTRSDDACRRYLYLASVESRSNMLDEAVADASHALSLYGEKASEHIEYSQIPFSSRDTIILILKQNNRKQEAEKLYLDAVAIAIKTCGPGSRQALNQQAAFVEYYVDGKDNDKAFAALDKLLAGDLRIYSEPNGIIFHDFSRPTLQFAYDWARRSSNTDPKLARTILDKIFQAQKAHLASDNKQFAATYQAMAEVEKIAGNDTLALDYYQKEFDIKKLYDGEAQAARQIPGEYLTLLKNAGKADRAEQLDTIRKTQIWPTPASERKKKNDLLESDLNLLKNEYEKSKADGAYSAQTSSLLARLVQNARKQKNYIMAREGIMEQIKTAEHLRQGGETMAGYQRSLVDIYLAEGNFDAAKELLSKLPASTDRRHNGLSNYQRRLFDAYMTAEKLDEAGGFIHSLWNSSETNKNYLVSSEMDLARACIKAGKAAQAKQLINEVLAHRSDWLSSLQQFSTATDLADLAIDNGETKYVSAVIDRAETIAGGDDGEGAYALPEVTRLWRKVGNEQRASLLESKYKDFIAKEAIKQGFRPVQPDSDKDKVSRVQTKVGVDFPPSSEKVDYPFSFVAVASHSLVLDDKARICQVQGGPISFAGSYGELKAGQSANHSGDLSFVSSSAVAEGMKLPSVPALPLKPIVKPPANESLGGVGGIKSDGLKLGLDGNFMTSGLDLAALTVQSQEKSLVRLFISDSEDKSLAFHLQPGGLVNAKIPSGPPPNDSNVEIWYGGSGTIKLDRNSTFNGIIYAPNGRVEIGPGLATFVGSIVAKDIVVTGESRLFANPEFAKWSISP